MRRTETEGPDNKASEDDDALLVARACAGESEGLARLYERHFSGIYRYVSFQVRDPADVEDLTGEVFLKMVAALPRYRPGASPFSAWLYRIARNQVTDFHRRERRRATHPIQNEPGGSLADPAASAEASLMLESLRVAVGKLSRTQQQALALRFGAGLGLAETAAAMGKSVGAVKALQHDALVALRRQPALAEQVVRW